MVLGQQAPLGLPTTVQLPTISTFSVDTSVSIPDSGGAYTEAARLARMRASNGLRPAGAGLGSISSERLGEPRAAVANRAQALSIGKAGASVQASIHLPSRPAAVPAASGEQGVRFAEALAAARQSTAGRPALSVSQARAARLADQRARREAGMSLIARGDLALNSGNRAAASIYYQRAQRHGDKHIKERALARLRNLSRQDGQD
jgi:hypothetical protein